MLVYHNSNEIRLTLISRSANIQILVDNVVGIDEAQFFDDGIVAVYNDLENRDVCVIITELEDFKEIPIWTNASSGGNC